MPTSTRKRVSKKSSPGEKLLRIAATMLVGARMSPFPATYRCKLRYGDEISCASSASNSVLGAEQVFALNSLFKPDITNTGHQPYGMDQLTQIYRSYRVERVKVKLTVTMFTAGANDTVVIFYGQITPAGATPAQAAVNVTSILDQPSSFNLQLSADGNAEQRKWSADIPISAVEGLKPTAFQGNPNYSALCTANPALMPRLTYSCAPKSAATTTVIVNIELLYDATFYQQNNLAQST